MRLGMIGLGRMGLNIATRLMQGGHQVVVYDINPAAVEAAVQYNAEGASSLENAVRRLTSPRTVWVMLPSGDITGQNINALVNCLQKGDTIIEGGNSNYRDSITRALEATRHGIHWLDVGTSGGIWGLKEGYCLMIGGRSEVVELCRPIFETLAPSPDSGWGRVGPEGAGHYAKMIHNGIEYGLMQAYAEGLEILHTRKDMIEDIAEVGRIWQHGSVVRSWLLDLIAGALRADPDMNGVQDYVPDSGEGRWTIAEAIDLNIPTPVITLSLLARLASRQDTSYAAKLLAMMRNRFGGHPNERPLNFIKKLS